MPSSHRHISCSMPTYMNFGHVFQWTIPLRLNAWWNKGKERNFGPFHTMINQFPNQNYLLVWIWDNPGMTYVWKNQMIAFLWADFVWTWWHGHMDMVTWTGADIVFTTMQNFLFHHIWRMMMDSNDAMRLQILNLNSKACSMLVTHSIVPVSRCMLENSPFLYHKMCFKCSIQLNFDEPFSFSLDFRRPMRKLWSTCLLAICRLAPIEWQTLLENRGVNNNVK